MVNEGRQYLRSHPIFPLPRFVLDADGIAFNMVGDRRGMPDPVERGYLKLRHDKGSI